MLVELLMMIYMMYFMLLVLGVRFILILMVG